MPHYKEHTRKISLCHKSVTSTATHLTKSNHLISSSMFIEIIKAEYLDEYRLRLWFNNGKVKEVDLSDSLKGKIFVPLQDKEFFKRFTIRFNTIEWENGADFAPEYLYEKGVTVYEPQEPASNFAAEENAPYNSEQ